MIRASRPKTTLPAPSSMSERRRRVSMWARASDSSERSGGYISASWAAGTGRRELRQPGQHAAPAEFLVGDGEGDVVAPRAVDVQEALVVALLAQAELLDDAQARTVLGADVHLDAVQTDLAETVVDDQRERG